MPRWKPWLPFLLLSNMLCNWESQETKAIGYFIVCFLLNIRGIMLPMAELQRNKQASKTEQLCPPSTSSLNIFNYQPTKCESSKKWVSGLGSCLTKQVHLSRRSSQESRGHLCFHNWMNFSLLTWTLFRGKASERKKHLSQLTIPTYLLQHCHRSLRAFLALRDNIKKHPAFQWSYQKPCCLNECSAEQN